MSPSRPFILRPVATALLMVAILLAGTVAWFQLPVSALPQVDYPTIQVQTFYPGASPDVMSSAVTGPLERQFGQIPGLTEMTSTSSGGGSIITLQFSLSESIDVAQQDVQAAINAANSYLPKDLPNPPIYNKVNPADAPILTLALTSDTLELTKVEDLADTVLAQKISQLSGVGLVSIAGGQKPGVRIQANPTALAGYGLSLEDMRTALASANVDQAKGNLNGAHQSYTIGANDQILTASGYNDIIIAYRNGSPVFLRDIANSVDAAENEFQAAWMGTAPENGEAATVHPAVIVNIQRQPGANIIGVVDRIQAILPRLQATLPASVKLQVLTDRTGTIRASIKDVNFELLLTIGLVILVIFLFLRSWRATIIPAVAVPLSIVGTFGVMYMLGYSLDNLSLMALTISTGFVVDDAIVMVENIDRYLEEGHSPLDAALMGSEQIGFTILSLTISLIAVLIPLLFMGDIVGRLFREFAVTLSVTILVSAVVSLTLTPMMAAKLLKHTPASEKGRFYKKSEEFFEWVIARYATGVRFVLRHQVATLLVTLATFILTVVLYVIVPKGFFPVQDTGVILAITDTAQDTSFSAMAGKQTALAEKILEDPDVESLSSFIGIDSTNTTLNSGRIQINLKDKEERTSDATAVIRRLQPKLNQVEGIQAYLQPLQDLTVENRTARTQYQFSVEDASTDELIQYSDVLLRKFRTLPALADVATDQTPTACRRSSSSTATPPHASASRRRTSTTPSTTPSASARCPPCSPSRISTTSSWKSRPGSSAIPRRSTTSTSRARTAHRFHSVTFTHFEQRPTTLAISHQGQFPSVNLSFNLAPGDSIGDAVKQVNAAVKQLNLPLSVNAQFEGTAASFEASLDNQATPHPRRAHHRLHRPRRAVRELYPPHHHPVHAAVGRRRRHPRALITGSNLSVIALIGIILLIGIVKKNAIMMIDFALEAEREHGKAPEEAIYQACLLRFRPIMMTTMAALLGGVPLALGSGTGSELRRPLGITIVGGLIVSQVLTLFTTPVVYLFFDRIGRRYFGTEKADREFQQHAHEPQPHYAAGD